MKEKLSEFDILLDDRIRVIQNVDNKYDLECNAYLSFSGGKDSTILHYLLDLALPGNKIPRLFIDTGIEYQYIREFVLDLQKKDSRFVVIKPGLPIKPMLEKYGYPFKSKEFSAIVHEFNKGHNSKYITDYINNVNGFGCPSCLKYIFSVPGKYNFSKLCCNNLKKMPAFNWSIENRRPVVITGMRSAEGGLRSFVKRCILTGQDGSLKKFHPLLVCDNNFEKCFIERFNVKLCKLYYPPYNFDRTGCKGCPYNPDLKKDLKILQNLLPNEYKQCCFIWQPVYDEYRRIGYRL